jgi:Cd2+/Zn2+-exporting ATPase
MEKKFILEGLDCANCSAKIESEINQIRDVKASINFITKTLSVKISNTHDTKTILKQIEAVVLKHEPDILIKEELAYQQDTANYISEDTNKNNFFTANKKEVIRLSIGAVLFATGIILKASVLTEFFIFLSSYLVVGFHILLRAVRNITKGKIFDENFLMSIATIGAFIIGQSAEGAAVMLFYQLGELFENTAVNRSRKSIRSLLDIRPDYAIVQTAQGQHSVAAKEIEIGQNIIVRAGERVPLDGIVIKGESFIDTSALTGEPVPRRVKEGDEILSGSINKNNVLTIKTTKKFNDSTVSKIIDLVQNAASRKARMESFITKFARAYTPAVVFAALAIALIPPVFVKNANLADWVYRALIFLVISCPCALVISIPLGFFGGIGAASKNGILIKGSNYLEALNYASTVVFDKTGTLTKGEFKVLRLVSVNHYTKEELLEAAAYAEGYSTHPIARAVISFYGKDIDQRKIQSYEEISGEGIIALVDGKEILAGNEKLLEGRKVNYTRADARGSIVYVAKEGEYIGYLEINDEIKADAADAIKTLKKEGITKTVMLTGDAATAAWQVAKDLNIDEVHAQLLPNDKVEKIEYLQAQKRDKEKIIFVGDGINDAPALARADISIAMGALGSDAAIEAADIVIMTDELTKLAQAKFIAKRTKKIIWQNIIFALSVKGIFLALGAFGFATMWEAVFADVGVAFIAVVNAMRAMKMKKL